MTDVNYIVINFHGSSMVSVSLIHAENAVEALDDSRIHNEYDENFYIEGFFGIGGFARKIDMSRCPVLTPENPSAFVEWCFDEYVAPLIPNIPLNHKIC